jgi:hypothetical protein
MEKQILAVKMGTELLCDKNQSGPPVSVTYLQVLYQDAGFTGWLRTHPITTGKIRVHSGEKPHFEAWEGQNTVYLRGILGLDNWSIILAESDGFPYHELAQALRQAVYHYLIAVAPAVVLPDVPGVLEKDVQTFGSNLLTDRAGQTNGI